MRQITWASQGSFEKYGRKSQREQFLEDAFYESAVLRRFAGVDLYSTDQDPSVGTPIFTPRTKIRPWGHRPGPRRGDGGYRGQGEAIREAAPEAQDMTCRRIKHKGGVGEEARRKHRTKSRVRAKVERPFRILKRIFGFTKVRYRGLKKNHEWLGAAFALVNLYMHRKRLVALAW